MVKLKQAMLQHPKLNEGWNLEIEWPKWGLLFVSKKKGDVMVCFVWLALLEGML
jgi:hypothetical protein